MAAITEKDRSLHNFCFPNCGIVRNMKAASSLPRSDGPNLAASLIPQLHNLPKPTSDHHLEEAERHGESTNRKKPWTLREKKSSTPAAPGSVGNIPAAAAVLPPAENRSKSLRLSSLAARAAEGGKEKKEKHKLSIALSREEINADFVAWKGSKYPRRPRKRPRNVQIELDVSHSHSSIDLLLFSSSALQFGYSVVRAPTWPWKLKFPGLWLAEITLDSYIIPEMRESKEAD